MTAPLPPYARPESSGCPVCGSMELWYWQTQDRVPGAGRVSLLDHWRCVACLHRWTGLAIPSAAPRDAGSGEETT